MSYISLRNPWVIRPLYGQAIEDYSNNSAAFGLAFNNNVSFEKTNTGLIRICCGQVQVPETYAYPVERLTKSKATDVAAVLRAVPMAHIIDGRPFFLPIEENHIMIIGRTGAGKNSWTWSLVFGLAQAVLCQINHPLRTTNRSKAERT